MKLVKITFSPTGGTQKVTDIVAAALGGEVSEIDLTDWKQDFSSAVLEEGDLALLAVPSFGGRVPALAAERFKKINGNGVRCILICVYGNRAYEDTLVELKDLAAERGFRVIAAISAVAEHSIMHQYAAGRPDREDETELREFAKQILQKLDDDGAAQGEDIHLPGNRPYKKAGGGGMVPKAGKACTICGLCAEKCPAQAISYEDPKVTDPSKCISCMRCVSVCPQSARALNKAMVSAAALAMKKVCSQRKNNEMFL